MPQIDITCTEENITLYEEKLKKEEENSITSKKLLSSSIKKLDIESMIEEQKKEYPDMEEWEGDKYKGIGIKRMKGYKCNLPIDKLNCILN